MFEIGRWRTARSTVAVAATERSDGDLHPLHVDADALGGRQRALTGQAWTMLDQVHGTDVVVAPSGGGWTPTVGRGDILVARDVRTPIAVWTADCAPLMLVGRDGTVVGAHAGWRGLAAGAIDVAVAEMEPANEIVAAVLGPCIRSCCYEFGDVDLRAVAAGVGVDPGALRATTRDGELALDVPTAVRAGLQRRGIEVLIEGSCTGCDGRFFSHRTRDDRARHALVATAPVAP